MRRLTQTRSRVRLAAGRTVGGPALASASAGARDDETTGLEDDQDEAADDDDVDDEATDDDDIDDEAADDDDELLPVPGRGECDSNVGRIGALLAISLFFTT